MKLVSLVSGGIDSPVASYIMSRVGADVILLHMDNGQYCDGKDLDKVLLISEQLEKITEKKFPVYVAKHEPNQSAIKQKCDYGYQCVMCKRVMQHVAREFAKKNDCTGIIMGDSLGQVASQTLRNIRAEGQNLNFPIIRPLIGMDKQEIINIANEIGTYKLSIIPTTGCGAVPIKPITEAKPEKIIQMQAKLDFDGLIATSVESVVRIH
jgi:thiamine biosynthesis protein ThiI